MRGGVRPEGAFIGLFAVCSEVLHKHPAAVHLWIHLVTRFVLLAVVMVDYIKI